MSRLGFWEKLWAPAKALKVLKNLEVKDEKIGRVLPRKKVLYNGQGGGWQRTLVAFLSETGNPKAVASINTSEDHASFEIAKMGRHGFSVYYKGERLFPLPSGQSGGFKWHLVSGEY